MSSPVFASYVIKYPEKYKFQNPSADKYGHMPCPNDALKDIYKCITYHDEAILKININNLLTAHGELVFIIEKHNADQDFIEQIKPSDLKCKALDFKCKKLKNKLMGF